MKILYIGSRKETALQRAQTLERLGHEVSQVDPQVYVPKGKLLARIHHETGGIWCEKVVAQGVMAEIGRLPGNPKFDVAWVDSGRHVGPQLLRHLRGICGPIVNYNHDDPWGSRDRFSWSLFRRAVPDYDLMVVVRPINISEAKARKAKDVMLVIRGADEVAHRPRELTQAIRDKWSTDVLFVGTWMPERGPFMAELVSLGVPLSIYGWNWRKAREWPQIQSAWKGEGLGNPDDYSYALQCSKVALGLLSKGNRDLHTQRSSEIPAMGALFCAERTTEHLDMYEEGVEALFWDDAKECAAVCKKILADDQLRISIAARGHERVIKNHAFNEPNLKSILDHVLNKDTAVIPASSASQPGTQTRQ